MTSRADRTVALIAKWKSMAYDAVDGAYPHFDPKVPYSGMVVYRDKTIDLSDLYEDHDPPDQVVKEAVELMMMSLPRSYRNQARWMFIPYGRVPSDPMIQPGYLAWRYVPDET